MKMPPPDMQTCHTLFQSPIYSLSYGGTHIFPWSSAGLFGLIAAVSASLTVWSATPSTSQLHTHIVGSAQLTQPMPLPAAPAHPRRRRSASPVSIPPPPAADPTPSEAASSSPRQLRGLTVAVFLITNKAPAATLLAFSDGPFAAEADSPRRWPPRLLALPTSAFNPFGLLDTLSSALGGDPIDIEPVRPEQLRPNHEQYVLGAISSLLAREIFRLEEGSDLCRKVTTTIENFTLRQYGMAPLEGKLQMFIAKNRKTSELAGCVFLKKFSMVGSREYEPVSAAELPLMESLAVEPKYAGRGIGGQLVKNCEKTAQQWGFDRLMLQVYSENTNAIRFYQKRGYKEVCEDNTIQRPVSASLFGIRWQEFDHKVMVKELSSGPC